MKQLTVISGKGGTGKTSLTAAFASLASNAVFADCDVDAADLHLILQPQIKETIKFHGLQVASLEKNLCTQCNQCITHCQFHAISDEYFVIEESCEGCGVCEYVCPADAITLRDRESGYAYISDTRFGPLSHATLHTAEEASGKLVSLVRENALTLAKKHDKSLIIIDGPPGIGCPVISSITGVDLVLVVTEPTMSAQHDLQRIIGVADHFNIPAVVCINKYDINKDNTKKIEQYCQEHYIPLVGKLPYDQIVTQAMIHEQSVIEYSTDHFAQQLKTVWENVHQRLIS